AHLILVGLHAGSGRPKTSALFLWEWLANVWSSSIQQVLAIFGEASMPMPSSPAQVIGRMAIDDSARKLLAAAVACAKGVSSTNPVSVRPLLGAMLLGPSAHEHGSAVGLIGEKGFAFEHLTADYLEFIQRTMPGEGARWKSWASASPAAEDAIEAGPASID